MHISEIFGLYKCGMRVRGVWNTPLPPLFSIHFKVLKKSLKWIVLSTHKNTYKNLIFYIY